jgi:hypothetical protein
MDIKYLIFIIFCCLAALPFSYLIVRIISSAFFESLKEYKNKGDHNDSK